MNIEFIFNFCKYLNDNFLFGTGTKAIDIFAMIKNM